MQLLDCMEPTLKYHPDVLGVLTIKARALRGTMYGG